MEEDFFTKNYKRVKNRSYLVIFVGVSNRYRKEGHLPRHLVALQDF